MTYRILAEQIANVLNQPFNHELKQRIKDSFKFILATRIRQQVQQYGIDNSLKVNYTLPLEKENDIQSAIFNMTSKHSILNDIKYKLRTTDKVANSISIANDAPFTKVSTLTHVIIPFKTVTEIKHDSLRFSSELSYLFSNGYIYVVGKSQLPKITSILIESIFEDMDTVLSYYDDILNEEDVEIPIPYNMIQSIKQELLKTEFGIIQQEDVTVELDK